MSKQITQEQFNTIVDLRYFLISHPDLDMIETACLHFLGDRHQKFHEENNKEFKVESEFDYGFNIDGNTGIYKGSLEYVTEIVKEIVLFIENDPDEFEYMIESGLIQITEIN